VNFQFFETFMKFLNPLLIRGGLSLIRRGLRAD